MKIIKKGVAKGIQKKAIQCFDSGNFKEATEIWAEIVEKEPNNVIALKSLACCMFIDDKMREARSFLEEAQSYAAADPEIANLLALTYLKEGNVQQAIEKILDAQEFQSHALLDSILEKIKNLNDPDHAKAMSLIPMIQLTLPRTEFISIDEKYKKYTPVLVILLVILLFNVFYPNLRNVVTSLNIRNRGEISPATQVSIKGIKEIVDARANFRIILDEKVIIRKFEELKQAISDQQHNKAKILVNEILASNASLAVKERVGILESFIVDPNVDSVDYVPTYAEIAVAPAIYEGIMLRWSGTVANIHHQGRQKTTFDILVNFLGQGLVEGIALVEVEGLQELNNGDKITVIGPILGISEDNRIIMQGQKIIPQ